MAGKRKSNINDYKDRMTCPVGITRLDKNGKPLKKSTKKRGK